jgi:hypothetical protein
MSNRLVSRGMRAGFWAAVVLAIWFSAVDVVRGLPLSSPAYMSGLIFSFTTALPATARLFAFAVILLVVYGAIGAFTAVLLNRLRIEPRWYAGVAIGCVLFGLGYVLGVTVFGVNLPRALGWFATAVGDLLTGIVIVSYLRRRRATA